MALNPFQFPYVSGVAPTDFNSTFQANDSMRTPTTGIGIPTRNWMDWFRNPLGSAFGAATDFVTPWIVRAVFVLIGLALVIIAIWAIAKGPNTIQLVRQ